MQELLREPKDERSVRIDYGAEVTGMWTTSDPGMLQALDPFHVWSPQYLETRHVLRVEGIVGCARIPSLGRILSH